MVEGQDQKGDGKSDMEVENDEEPKEDKDDKDEVEAPRMMARGGAKVAGREESKNYYG